MPRPIHSDALPVVVYLYFYCPHLNCPLKYKSLLFYIDVQLHVISAIGQFVLFGFFFGWLLDKFWLILNDSRDVRTEKIALKRGNVLGWFDSRGY